jgi:4-amino-4-deoxy-L-arabinose transferase-like glycosyltransferase
MRPAEEPQGLVRDGGRALLLILLLALVLRLAFFVAVQPWNAQVLPTRVLFGDASEYNDLALRLLQDRSFANFGAVRTPGYPLFLAAFYFVFGDAPWVVLLFQAFLSAAAVLLVYGLARAALPRKVALIAALLYAIEPHSIMYAATLLTDSVFTFVFLASVLALVLALRRKSIGLAAAGGALLGLATLFRPITQAFPVVALAVIVIYAGIRWRFRLATAATFAVAFVVVLSPWLYRNYATYGHASLSSIDGYNLLFYNAAYTEVAQTGEPIEEVRAEFRQQAAAAGYRADGNPFDNSRVFSNVATAYIFSNLGAYIPRHILGAVNMFANLATKDVSYYLGLETHALPFEFFASPGPLRSVLGFLAVKSLPEIVIGLVVGGFLLLTYMLALIGAVDMIRKRQYVFLAVLLLTILYFSALTGVVGLARYKLPVTPFYLILSAQGLAAVLEWRSYRATAPNP